MTDSGATRQILAIVPARGGSKGIPRKNLQLLAGKPLLVHTLEHARQTPEITLLVVSTDDPEIAAVARQHGAKVVNRPAELAGDEASSESALLHVLEHLARREAYAPDLVVFLQATSPLRRPDDISRAIAALDAAGADSLFSASSAHGFVWRQHGGELRSLSYDYRQRPRRQEIGLDLLENGSIYVTKPWVLERHGNRLGGRIAVYPMDPLDSFQVDEPADLALLEQLLALRRTRPAVPDLAPIRLLALDFDGVMTDDRVLVDQDGREAVLCHRGDGLGLERLRRSGLPIVVLSKEKNPVVGARCRKLGIPCHQGHDDKLPQLQAIAREHGVEAHQVAYVGNDVNDLECLAWAGMAIAVADARPEIRAAAAWVTAARGGYGAVREICDALLAARPAVDGGNGGNGGNGESTGG